MPGRKRRCAKIVPHIIAGFPNVRRVPLFPHTTGIYILFRAGVPVYVGQGNSVGIRIAHHIAERKKEFDDAYCIPVKWHKLDVVESALITLLAPKYNRRQDGRLHDACLPDEAMDVVGKYLPPEMVGWLKSCAAINCTLPSSEDPALSHAPKSPPAVLSPASSPTTAGGVR